METTNKVKIDDNFCFDTKKHLSIADFQKALKLYSSNLDEASKLEGDMPIFLDTNVLLDYYEIPLGDRKNLKEFFIKHKNRIYITDQIEKEFLRNRAKAIKNFRHKTLDTFKGKLKDITNEIDEKFNELSNQFEIFLNWKNILKKDYPDSYEKMNSLKDKIDKFSKELKDNKKILNDKMSLNDKSFKEIELYDEILDIFSQFEMVASLEDSEIEFIEGQYDNLLEKDKNLDKNLFQHTFPGRGDKKGKDYPYGDFIIYHEMLKFCYKEEKSVIFLTKDTTKEDWLQKSSEPYVHYIINTFLNTSQTIVIVDAKRLFKKLFEDISFGNIRSWDYGREDLDRIIEQNKNCSRDDDVIEEWYEWSSPDGGITWGNIDDEGNSVIYNPNGDDIITGNIYDERDE